MEVTSSSHTQQLQSTCTNQQWDAARFLLHCSTRYSLSHTAVDGISTLTEELVEQTTRSIANKVTAVLNEYDVSSSCRAAILQQFHSSPERIFDGLHTQYARESFYIANFNLVVCIWLPCYYWHSLHTLIIMYRNLNQ